MRKRKGREYWLGMILRFEEGGLSQARFCTRYKLNIGTFRAWLYRLRGEGVLGKQRKKAKFFEVEHTASDASPGLCTLRIDQIAIEFRQPPNVSYLRDLVAGLRAECR